MRTDRFHFLALLMAVLSMPVLLAAQEESTSAAKTQKATLELEKSKPVVSAQPAGKVQILDVEMTTIEGEKVNLKRYTGNVVLIVNVASKCGFTGQYRPLQALHDKYSAKGLRVVAFPCNQFGNQEPKGESEINAFCKNKFGIKFDMFSKVNVKGKNQALLFKKLTTQKLGPVGSGDIRWNFEKFLIDRKGTPIARFASNMAPDNKVIVARIESALGIEKKKAVKTKEAKKKSKEPVKPSPKPEPANNSETPEPAPAAKKPGLSQPDNSEPPV